MYKLIMLVGILLLLGCSNSDPVSSGNAPSDHTINKDGIKHKSGLTNPQENCTSCHGNDLKGGTNTPSCYSCHGTKW